MINWFKKSGNESKTREEILSSTMEMLGDNLLSLITFGSEVSLKELTGMNPTLLIVTKVVEQTQFRELSLLLNELEDESSLIVSMDELASFPFNYPLELVHIKNDYSVIYGFDCFEAMQSSDETLKVVLQREFFSLIINLRSALLDNRDSCEAGVSVLCRFLLIGKGLLELRNIPVPTSWGSLVTEIESCYSVKEFALSEMIVALEGDKASDLAPYLNSLLFVFEDIFKVITAQNEGVA